MGKVMVLIQANENESVGHLIVVFDHVGTAIRVRFFSYRMDRENGLRSLLPWKKRPIDKNRMFFISSFPPC